MLEHVYFFESKTMLQIIYFSTAIPEINISSVRNILECSRQHNHDNDVTGILFYDGRNFIQVIEGEDSTIEALFSKISSDRRHYDVRLLSRMDIPQREFGDWLMAFACPESAAGGEPGRIDYGPDLVDFDITASRARRLLFMFVEGALAPSPADGSSVDFTLRIHPSQKVSRMITTTSTEDYLVEFGRTIALAVPDAEVNINVSKKKDIHFNKKGNVKKGHIEFF